MSEESYPKEFRPIIRRLLQAGAEQDVRETMIMEDEVIDGKRIVRFILFQS
jgi:hypothetical protein